MQQRGESLSVDVHLHYPPTYPEYPEPQCLAYLRNTPCGDGDGELTGIH